ncbi:MAG: hypothetical protein U9Q68_00700 [Euryarchaeota archaeon]|nr:hypothetical protein [Euryarchaeota archaeon]
MAYTELSLGIVIGIILSLVVDVIKEIVVREYNTRKDDSLRIKSIREDLKAYITSLCVIWENYKISESMHKEFRKDMEYQIREIIDYYYRVCERSGRRIGRRTPKSLLKIYNAHRNHV